VLARAWVLIGVYGVTRWRDGVICYTCLCLVAAAPCVQPGVCSRHVRSVLSICRIQ